LVNTHDMNSGKTETTFIYLFEPKEWEGNKNEIILQQKSVERFYFASGIFKDKIMRMKTNRQDLNERNMAN
jgi:hypothetical protein